MYTLTNNFFLTSCISYGIQNMKHICDASSIPNPDFKSISTEHAVLPRYMPQTIYEILKKKRNALKWLVLCEVIMQCVPFRGTLEAHPRTACVANIVLVCLQHFVQKRDSSCKISNSTNLLITYQENKPKRHKN